MHVEYFFILVYLWFCICLCILILLANFFLGPKFLTIEKISAYECGFRPFADTRYRFDVHYYLVAILFIVFDIEISFLFPWAIVLREMNIVGFVAMIFFLLILTLGYVYELHKNALEWH